NCTPITLRDEGVAVHREDVDIPEILLAGSVGVVTAVPPEPYDAGDIGENQTSVRVAVVLARAGRVIRRVLGRQDRVEVKDDLLRRLRNGENVAVLEKDTGQAGKALVVDHRFTNPTQ